MTKVLISVCIVLILFSSVVYMYANDRKCEETEDRVMSNCRIITYADLPPSVKDLMAHIGCDVTSSSNYDYGYAVDLNDDGHKEYAFCCKEAPHGPCDMKIFTKVDGVWQDIAPDMMAGYGDGRTPCFGFTVMESITNGYHDICNIDGTLKYLKGGYRWAERFDVPVN